MTAPAPVPPPMPPAGLGWPAPAATLDVLRRRLVNLAWLRRLARDQGDAELARETDQRIDEGLAQWLLIQRAIERRWIRRVWATSEPYTLLEPEWPEDGPQ